MEMLANIVFYVLMEEKAGLGSLVACLKKLVDRVNFAITQVKSVNDDTACASGSCVAGAATLNISNRLCIIQSRLQRLLLLAWPSAALLTLGYSVLGLPATRLALCSMCLSLYFKLAPLSCHQILSRGGTQ
jgi:hypothetical protein